MSDKCLVRKRTVQWRRASRSQSWPLLSAPPLTRSESPVSMTGDRRTPFDLGVVGQRLIWEGCRFETGG